jgi:MFS family permease
VGGLVWRFLTDRPADARWLTPTQAALLSDRATAQDIPAVTRVRGTMRQAFGSPVILVLAAIYFVNQVIQSAVLFNFPSVLQELGLTSTFWVGVVAGGTGLTGLAGALLFPWLKRRYGHEVVLIGVCAGATLVLMIGFLMSTGVVGRVVLVLLSTFFGLGALPLFWSVAMSRMAGVLAAAGLAFVNTLGTSGNFAGPILYGRIEEATGSVFAPYYTIVGAACAGLALVPLLALVMRREKRAGTVGRRA